MSLIGKMQGERLTALDSAHSGTLCNSQGEGSSAQCVIPGHAQHPVPLKGLHPSVAVSGTALGRLCPRPVWPQLLICWVMLDKVPTSLERPFSPCRMKGLSQL